MSLFNDTFSSRHVILPVIHVDGLDQALRNTDRAISNGCDGVFLINHQDSAKWLLEVHQKVREQCPDIWIGVNLLDKQPWDAFKLLDEGVNGLWVDQAFIGEDGSQAIPKKIHKDRIRSGWKGLYFGGVAFKYQQPVEDLAEVSRVAGEFMDVITTSGPGTGKAAEIEKIREMRSASSAPLAIASGVTVENVGGYLPIADCFLVATGISESWTELDPVKVKQLVKKVRGSEL
jgi:predicted TIM-barrel enzyme